MYPWQVTNGEDLLKLSPNWQSWEGDRGQKKYYYVNQRSGEVYIEGSFNNTGIFKLDAYPTFEQEILRNYEGEVYLPFQIDITHYPIDISRLKITNFTGLPSKILGSFIVNDSTIKSIEGFPPELTEFHFNHLPIQNNLHKHLKKANEIFLGNDFNYRGFLSFILIKDLQEIFSYSKYKPIIDVINKHLQSDRDVLECQEELIEMGFKEYAKL